MLRSKTQIADVGQTPAKIKMELGWPHLPHVKGAMGKNNHTVGPERQEMTARQAQEEMPTFCRSYKYLFHVGIEPAARSAAVDRVVYDSNEIVLVILV